MASTKSSPKTDENKERAKAYNRAQARLREAHNDEWQSYLAEEYEAAGLTYKPRLTPEQKAEKKIEELLAEFPQLKDRTPF